MPQSLYHANRNNIPHDNGSYRAARLVVSKIAQRTLHLLVLAISALMITTTSDAAITLSGDISPNTYNGTDNIWIAGGNFIAGNASNGSIVIDGGSEVISGSSLIAVSPGTTGTATVSGHNSKLTSLLGLAVGVQGNGSLMVEDGGLITNTEIAYIGFAPGSFGEVTIQGGGTEWINSNNIEIGSIGDGIMNILSGGLVSNSDSRIANLVGTTGRAVISGHDSTWNNTGNLTIGNQGAGEMDVFSGGSVSSVNSFLGVFANSSGHVTVSGADSNWINSGNLLIGANGTGTMTVDGGGRVENDQAIIGQGAVSVTGDHSNWISQGKVELGGAGLGFLAIEDGGSVSSLDGFIGNTHSGAVTVSGEDSSWSVSDSIYVGAVNNTAGGPNLLNIETGSRVSVGNNLAVRVNGALNINGGTLHFNGGGLTALGGTSDVNFIEGRIEGADIIDINQPLVQQGGTLAPGQSTGTTEILGDYSLTAGTVEIEIGGIGNSHDILTATGNIDITSLGSILSLPILGPVDAGSYTIIESLGGVVTGQFENVTGLGIFDNLVDVEYTSTSITLIVNQDIVPEPVSISLVTLGGLAMIQRRR